MTNTVLLSNAFGSATKKTMNDGIEVIELSHQNFNASMSLYGGQVLSWQPKGHKDVFWLSDKAEFKKGKAIRGGIPLCWPWFGPNLKEDGSNGGNHGFVRNRIWQLDSIDINEETINLVVKYCSESEHEMWPSQFSLEQTLHFGKNFSQQLKISNLSTEPVEFSSALHTYFAVSEPENTKATRLAEYPFADKLSGLNQQTDQLINCVGPIDRIYHCDKEQVLIDQQWQRQIKINSSNCLQWVLWNPGTEIAQNMVDIHPQGEQEFVCLEAANTAWQTLNSKQSITIGQSVCVSDL